MMLFELSELKTNNLLVLLNGEVVDLDVDTLFDAIAYDSIKVASFVASPEYLFKKLQGFKKLQVILGEEESARTLTALDVEKEVSFIKAIDSQRLKDNILSKAWEFKAMPPHMALHSKIYLLESSSKARVMVGSANLSRQAFEGRQYEELLVFDDPRIVAVYRKRFEEIWHIGVAWLGESTLKHLKRVDLSAQSLEVETIDSSIIHADTLHAHTLTNSIIITPELKVELLGDKIETLRNHHAPL